MKLKNWSITNGVNPNFVAPEMTHFHLQGNVYGHPRFNDGDPVITSRIFEINDKGDYKEVITRSGAVYELYKEDVDPECEKQFPNYYDRLKLTYIN